MPPTRPAILALVALLCLTPALVKLTSYAAYPGPDGAFIHVAVAEHVLDGAGWGIANHDRVNVSSSPLYVILLIGVLSVGSIGLVQCVSVVAACAALYIVYRATRAATGSDLAAIAALAVSAFNVQLWRWTGTAMETVLAYLAVTAIGALTIELLRSGRAGPQLLLVLGALIGLSCLIRYEIVLLLPLSILALVRARRSAVPTAAWVLAGAGLALIPWLVFSTLYFGSAVPTTVTSKSGGGVMLVNLPILKTVAGLWIPGFGVSLVIAAAAFVIARRSSQGRANLRASARPLAMLLAWPVGLLAASYFLMTTVAGSAGRYLMPGMATWPLAFGLIVAAVPDLAHWRRKLIAALVVALAVAVGVNIAIVRPVLASFNGGYRLAMTDAARYLQQHCVPGDTVVISAGGFGVLAREGVGHCEMFDGDGLASPRLRGAHSVAEQVRRVHPTYLVDRLGNQDTEVAAVIPPPTSVLSEPYAGHDLVTVGKTNSMRVYRLYGQHG